MEDPNEDSCSSSSVSVGDLTTGDKSFEIDGCFVEIDPQHSIIFDTNLEFIGRYADSGLCKHGKGGMCTNPGSSGRCTHSLYGRPLSPKEVMSKIGPLPTGKAKSKKRGDGGLVFKAKIVSDDYGKKAGYSARDYDAKKGEVKARRGNLTVTATNFLSSLVCVEMDDRSGQDEGTPYEEGFGDAVETIRRNGERKTAHDDDDDEDRDHNIFAGEKLEILTLPKVLRGSELSLPPTKTKTQRWIFSGVLNGWPALQCLELIKIEKRGKIRGTTTHWSSQKHGQKGTPPSFPLGSGGTSEVRAVLRAAPWTMNGWSQESPGFVYWYEAQRRPTPRLTYGTNIIRQFQTDGRRSAIPLAKKVHMVSHRYAKRETTKDRLTYHSLVLIEWDHGQYCTVIEGGWVNGLCGFLGRSNWFDDRDEDETELYRHIPPEMVLPWRSSMSEIRALDVAARNLGEFRNFISRYNGSKERRFIDPRFTFSHDVRLTFCSKEHVATYLLNYSRRDQSYSEMMRNCQTFAADFCGFLAGKKDVQPFHPVNQIQYKNQKHHFLYDSTMY